MKPLLTLFLALTLAVAAHAQVVPPTPQPTPTPTPAPKAPLVPAALTAKGGELLLIDASKATAAVLFDFDATVFDAKHATIDGKKLYLAMPHDDATKTYAVTVISDMPLSRSRVTITVPGDAVPTPVPPPDSLAKLVKDVAAIAALMPKLDARLTALEQIKPIPPPTTALLKHVSYIGAELNATSLAVNNDAGLRTLFTSAGIKVHVLKKDDPLIATKGLTPSVTKAGGAPCVIGQDDAGNVLFVGPMISAAGVTDLATPFIRR